MTTFWVDLQRWFCELQILPDNINDVLHCERKTLQKGFFDIQSTKHDRLWQNLVHIFLSKFIIQKCKRFPPHLNSVCTLLCETYHSRFASEQQLELWTEKTQMVLSYHLQNEADSVKVWYMFSWLNLQQCDVKVKKLHIFFNK